MNYSYVAPGIVFTKKGMDLVPVIVRCTNDRYGNTISLSNDKDGLMISTSMDGLIEYFNKEGVQEWMITNDSV